MLFSPGGTSSRGKTHFYFSFSISFCLHVYFFFSCLLLLVLAYFSKWIYSIKIQNFMLTTEFLSVVVLWNLWLDLKVLKVVKDCNRIFSNKNKTQTKTVVSQRCHERIKSFAVDHPVNLNKCGRKWKLNLNKKTIYLKGKKHSVRLKQKLILLDPAVYCQTTWENLG